MTKKILILIYTLVITTRLSAQMASFSTDAPVLAPPSPTASSLAMFADYPVSHYTGVPNISIPIYEIAVDDYKIPIHLNYHSSGIHVAQEASWVGLGWALSAGGSISRTVKCIDDFAEYGGIGTITRGYYNGPEISGVTGHFNSSGHQIVDSEPDIFYFNLPHASGKFVIDKSRGVVMFDKSQNIKIEVVRSGTYGYYFTVTDPEGVQYIFDRKEISQNHIKPGPLYSEADDNNVNNYVEFQQYASTWYLSKVLLPSKKEITFTYASETYSAPAQESCLKYNLISSGGIYSCDPPPSHTSPVYSRSKQEISALRLTRITWNSGYIDFPSSTRLDIRDNYGNTTLQKLDEIKVYSNAAGVLKQFKFSYSYFDTPGSNNPNYLYKRLKLDAVQEVGVGKYEMSYHPIGYLPAKNSTNGDYWGYYNGKSYGRLYYSKVNYNYNTYDGAVKSSNVRYLMTGMLTKLKFPTGGYNKFYYEENTFSNSVLEYAGNKGGGLRILQIESGGTNTTPKYRNFKYWGGKAITPQCLAYQTDYVCSGAYGESGFRRYVVQTSSSTLPLTSLRNGNMVGYNEVEERTTDGKNTQIVRYTFHNDVETERGHPFVGTHINFYNGLPQRVVYAYIDGDTKQEYQTKKIMYAYTSGILNNIKAFYYSVNSPEAVFYNYPIEWVRKTGETVITCAESGGRSYLSESSDIVEQTDYGYNGKNMQLSSIYTYPNGENRYQRTFYPVDFTDAVSQQMTSRHMVNLPVESIEVCNSNVISGKKVAYSYQSASDMYLPGVIYELSTPTALASQNYRDYYVPKVYFDKYNTKGKPVQVRTDDRSVVYLWGYKNQYPIAEINQATFSQITAIITEARLEEIANRNEPTTADWELIHSLRENINLRDAFVSVFKYKAMTGVSEITTPNGVVTYYDYDTNGLLKEVYFKENGVKRVVEYNEYKYANQ